MGVNQQFLQHLPCSVPLPAEIVSLGGYWGVSQVRRHIVLEQWKQMSSAE
jgi:hypothetical protein